MFLLRIGVWCFQPIHGQADQLIDWGIRIKGQMRFLNGFKIGFLSDVKIIIAVLCGMFPNMDIFLKSVLKYCFRNRAVNDPDLSAGRVGSFFQFQPLRLC